MSKSSQVSKEVLEKMSKLIVGRDKELELMVRAIEKDLPIIIEGPVGTGKTEMAKALSACLERPFIRVDGDDSLTSIKLKG